MGLDQFTDAKTFRVIYELLGHARATDNNSILFSTATIVASHLRYGIKFGDTTRVAVQKKDLWVGGPVKNVTPAICIEHSELLHTHI